MRTMGSSALYAILALFIFAAAGSAQDADSLVFITLRARVMSIDSEHPALATADALAAAGLFAEATAILREHAIADHTSLSPERHDSKQFLQWRVSSGVDYYHLEDVDTGAMTPEELRDYQRLTETPLSVWLRAKSTMKPVVSYVSELSPEVYLSERKSRVSVSGRSPLVGNFLQFEPSIRAEKWFIAGDADSTFAPVRRQPSDMGGLAVILTTTNSGQSPVTVLWSAPVSVDWKHFREDQVGYESFVEYGFSPSIEMRPKGSSMGTRISAQARYEDYYRTDSDSLDVARFSGRLEGFGRDEKHSALISAGWMNDWYTNLSKRGTATNLEAVNRIEGSCRFEYKIAPAISAHLRMRGIHERERRTGLSTTFAPHGSELIVEPAIEATLASHVRIIPELLWEQRWAGDNETLAIWDERRAWEPGLRIRWTSTIFEAALRGAFRYEALIPGPHENDNKSFRTAAEAAVNAGSLLTLSCFSDYQYRLYASRQRVSENLSVSASASFKL